MPEVFEVGSVEEAVELAHRFKAEGRYNWFRGQTQEWPPLASLTRLYTSKDTESIATFVQRIGMFTNWLTRTPELQYLREDARIHDFFAIAQHYGIPTHYIDFTTDPGVAGFFAADTKTPPAEGKSCIYCLDTAELQSIWEAIKDIDERRGLSIEVIEIDVRNLWRLQAQRGTFVYANYNWQIDFPMDRIRFPYGGYPSYPTHSEIYPQDKSPLEQRLDQYFSIEQSTFANQRFRGMIDEINARGGGAGYMELEELPGGYYAEAFVRPPDQVGSWAPDILQSWNVDPVEDYHETRGPTLSLQMPGGANVEKIRASVSFGVRQVLRSNPSYRAKVVDWRISGLPDSISQERLNALLRPVWNGMRRLPFTNEDIGDALAAVITLLMLGFPESPSSDQELGMFSSCFGECINVGFASSDGSGSRGVAARKGLQEALRSDMLSLLAPSSQHIASDIVDLFQIIYNPRRMFEFEAFKKIFAQNVIPAQALLKREPMLFNPTQLQTFGLL